MITKSRTLVLLGMLALGGGACGGVPSEQQGEAEAEQAQSALAGEALAIRFYNSGYCLELTGTTGLETRPCRLAGQPPSNSTQKWRFLNHNGTNGGIGKFWVASYFTTRCIADSNGLSTHVPVVDGCNAPNPNSDGWRDPQAPSTGGPPNYSGFKLQNGNTGLCLTTTQHATYWDVTEQFCKTTTTHDDQSLFLDVL